MDIHQRDDLNGADKMSFAGEDRYREALARAEGHEGVAAMIKVADLKAALVEIERLRADNEDLRKERDAYQADSAALMRRVIELIE